MKNSQNIRFWANGLVTVYLFCIIIITLLVSSKEWARWLWSFPVIVVSLLDIYFMTCSLLKKPQNIDTRFSTFLISVGATFGFSVWAMIIEPKQFAFVNIEIIQQTGKLLALFPYPFVVWSLLCLKDCLTVIPEAHTIIAHGPYKYSRHPLYICYIGWAITSFMMYPSFLMLIAAVGQIFFLFLRLRREESLLLNTFPEYRIYCKTVGLLGRTKKNSESNVTDRA